MLLPALVSRPVSADHGTYVNDLVHVVYTTLTSMDHAARPLEPPHSCSV